MGADGQLYAVDEVVAEVPGEPQEPRYIFRGAHDERDSGKAIRTFGDFPHGNLLDKISERAG